MTVPVNDSIYPFVAFFNFSKIEEEKYKINNMWYPEKEKFNQENDIRSMCFKKWYYRLICFEKLQWLWSSANLYISMSIVLIVRII